MAVALQCFGFLTGTHQKVYMRTHIVLNDALITEAMQLAKVKTKREAVDIALRRFVASQKQRRILELVGQELISPDYDYKAARMGDDSR